MLKVITFVCLVFQLPASWEETRRDKGTVPGLIPGTHVEEATAAWRGTQGEELYAFYWKPSAPRPGGPMAVTRSWKRSVAGREVTVSETSQFLGSHQEVLVTHLALPDAQVMIYGRNVGDNFFNATLDSLRLSP